jgi:ATP-binding cassette subfamily B protein
LLLEPPILILDDPTASVDPKTEHEIVSALRSAMAGRTAFIVANRLSLLQRADNILVLDGGRLIHQGTHAALVQIDGPYRETAMLQLMDLEGQKSEIRIPNADTKQARSTEPAGAEVGI